MKDKTVYVKPLDARYVATHDGFGTICRFAGALEGDKECISVNPVSKTQDIGGGVGKRVYEYDFELFKEKYKPLCIGEWSTFPYRKPSLFERAINIVKRFIGK